MNLNSRLLEAVEAGRLSECADLLEQGASPNAQSATDDTALSLAIRLKQPAIRDLLIASGADVDQWSRDRVTPLMIASATGDMESCRSLLAAGASVDMEGDISETALSYASGSGHVSICELLLENGADISATDMYGATALADAIKSGQQRVVDLLLRRGASVGAEEVTIAAIHGRLELLEQMLAEAERAGLDLLCEAFDTSVNAGHANLCRALVARGAFPDADDLVNAAGKGHLAVCELLIELGVEPDGSGFGCKSPLHAACEGGHVEVAKLLLDNGANVNIESEKVGWTPLYEAICRHGRNDDRLCRLLVRRGAETQPLCRVAQDRTPFQCAVFTGQVAAVRCLAEECNEDLDQKTVEGISMEKLAGVWTEVKEVVRSLRAEVAVSAAMDGETGVIARPRRSLSMGLL